jgi:hypothetical protein
MTTTPEAAEVSQKRTSLVVETYAGPDGLVRVVKVKTSSTVATYSKKKRIQHNQRVPCTPC